MQPELGCASEVYVIQTRYVGFIFLRVHPYHRSSEPLGSRPVCRSRKPRRLELGRTRVQCQTIEPHCTLLPVVAFGLRSIGGSPAEFNCARSLSEIDFDFSQVFCISHCLVLTDRCLSVISGYEQTVSELRSKPSLSDASVVAGWAARRPLGAVCGGGGGGFRPVGDLREV